MHEHQWVNSWQDGRKRTWRECLCHVVKTPGGKLVKSNIYEYYRRMK